MNRKNHLLAILAAVSLILASLAGCGGKTEPDVPQPTQKPVEYANLTDEDSRALLSRLLENAGIDETRIRGLFDRVDQFNASVKSEWLTNGFERAVPTDTKYDPYEMQDLWAEKNGDFPGYNCRITAFSLFGEFVTVGADQPKTQGEDTLFLRAVCAGARRRQYGCGRAGPDASGGLGRPGRRILGQPCPADLRCPA